MNEKWEEVGRILHTERHDDHEHLVSKEEDSPENMAAPTDQEVACARFRAGKQEILSISGRCICTEGCGYRF